MLGVLLPLFQGTAAQLQHPDGNNQGGEQRDPEKGHLVPENRGQRIDLTGVYQPDLIGILDEMGQEIGVILVADAIIGHKGHIAEHGDST